MDQMVRIAVVGDVHGVWNTELDRKALKLLNPDLVLFTGDFGNEDVELVGNVSKLDMPKAVILGNHDCWWSALSAENRIRFPRKKTTPTAVQDQIRLLGDCHVGFKRMDFQHLKLSVVGSRPFSIGGDSIFGKAHVSSFFGISDMESSTKKITELALGAPSNHFVVVLGHNGPTGLGSQPDDVCGKDFELVAGDHGDPDLQEALTRCKSRRVIPLVVFGHMHHKLCFDRGERKMVAVKDGTVYVNGAVVPRERNNSMERQFTMIQLTGSTVNKVTETWVKVTARSADIVGESVLYPIEMPRNEL